MSFDDVPGQFYVSCAPGDIDVPWVLQELRKTYWGGWLTLPVMDAAIRHSLCFGVFERAPFDPTCTVPVKDRQIGFARVVTDYATFAWLCDVVIAKPYRKKGLGKFLVSTVMQHSELRLLKFLLCTQDAKSLYQKFGFRDTACMKRNGGQ